MRLSMEHLSKQFGKKVAVQETNLCLKEGVYGFLGANGAGKTTLMQMVCGILTPTSGEIRIDGKRQQDCGEWFRDMLGYLPQEFGYPPGFTAREFLHYAASIKGLLWNAAKKKTEELLELTSLSGEAGKKIRTFSGGMKRRLGIAQALLNDPKILILDEPTAGLDPKERAFFRGMISDLAKDKLVLLSTHIVSDVEYIADEILMMKEGKMIMQGRPEKLIGSLEGKVWECTVPAEEWRAFERTCRVVNAHHRGREIDVRVLAEKPPKASARMAEPGLEDLYLSCFMEQGEASRL